MPKRKTHKEFVNEIKEKYNDEYEVLGQYKNTHTKILIKHNKCGHCWEITPHNLLQDHGCPECGKIKQAKNLRTNSQTFKEKFYQIPNNKIQLLGEYEKLNSKIKVRCSECGYEWFALPGNLLHRKSSCPKCYGHMKKTTEQFKKEVCKLVNTEYSVLGEYTSSKDKILMKHNICKNEWLVEPNKFIQGRRCPVCKESHGETSVRDFLKKHSIKFESQYKIKECKYLSTLIFDFAIFLKNNLVALIEYQGEQHYRSVDIFGGDKEFKIRQIRDGIKREYCKKQNIILIEIPYTIKDINSFLIKELSKLNIKIEEAV